MFEPYICQQGDKRFFVATEQGQRWYDPPSPALSVELDWIRANVTVTPETRVIDAGCHHGIYSLALGGGELYCVDLHKRNLDICAINCMLNQTAAHLFHAAVTNARGWVRCNDAPLGSVEAEGPDQVPSVKLADVCPNPDVVKLDIEGCEFLVLPEALDDLPGVHTWIVEIHPWWFEASGNKDLFTPFVERGYDLYWIDRAAENPQVVRLEGEVEWKMQSTLIAVKP